MWRGARSTCRDGAMQRRHGRRLRASPARIVAGAFGALTEVYGDLLRGAGAAGRLTELLAKCRRSARRPSRCALPEPAARPAGVRRCHLPLSRPGRDVSALHDFSLDVDAGRDGGHGRPFGRRQVDPLPARPALLRSAGGHGPHRRRRRCATPIRPTSARASRSCRRRRCIFAASARDNLRYGRWDASDDELWGAAEAANAAEFLRRLPEGLDTYLGEGGARLSGGQRQRIAIARALLRDAPLAAARRGDLRARRRKRAAGPGLARAADRGPHDDRHRPPPRHRARRRPDRGDGPWPDRRGRHSRRLSAAGGLYARLARLQFEGLAA